MSGGGGSGGTQKTEFKPPKYAEKPINQFINKTNKYLETPYEAYSGDTVAGFTGDMNSGMDKARNRAINGNAGLRSAENLNSSNMRGDYLNQGVFRNEKADMNTAVANRMAGVNNQYLGKAIDDAHGDVIRNFNNAIAPTTDANMARAGAFGGSAWKRASAENSRQLSNELGRLSNDMRYKDYYAQADMAEKMADRETTSNQTNQQIAENYANRQGDAFAKERAYQQDSIDNAFNFANQDYTDADVLMKMGQMSQMQNQNELDDLYGRWQDMKLDPLRKLDVRRNMLSTIMGTGGSSITSGATPNRYASGLGGAISGGIGAMKAASEAGYGGGVGQTIAALLGALGGGAAGYAG